jgi:hypothetical protein
MMTRKEYLREYVSMYGYKANYTLDAGELLAILDELTELRSQIKTAADLTAAAVGSGDVFSGGALVVSMPQMISEQTK